MNLASVDNENNLSEAAPLQLLPWFLRPEEKLQLISTSSNSHHPGPRSLHYSPLLNLSTSGNGLSGKASNLATVDVLMVAVCGNKAQAVGVMKSRKQPTNKT